MLRFKFTDKIRNLVEENKQTVIEHLSEESRHEILRLLKAEERDNWISWKALRDFIEYYNRKTKDQLRVKELLEGTNFFMLEQEKPRVNKELESLLERIRAENEEREYYRMINSRAENYTIKEAVSEWKKINKVIVTIFNILLSSFASGFMIFYLFGLYNEFNKLELRILLGLIVAIIVAVAETGLVYMILSVSEKEQVLENQSRNAKKLKRD